MEILVFIHAEDANSENRRLEMYASRMQPQLTGEAVWEGAPYYMNVTERDLFSSASEVRIYRLQAFHIVNCYRNCIHSNNSVLLLS